MLAPVLVYIYGPPAVGKLTVARYLSELTGWPLFHNHLTVDAVASVFPFGSAPFSDLLHRFRLDVFETAATQGQSVIFTNNSAWRGPQPRARFAAFAGAAESRVRQAGGRVLFVQLDAPLTVLEHRLAGEDRRALGKLVDPERLGELVRQLDRSPLHGSDLRIDTTETSPQEAARTIFAAIGDDAAP